MDAPDNLVEDRLRSPLRARTLDDFIKRVRLNAKTRPTEATFIHADNVPAGMVAMNIIQAVVQGLVVLGAYFFMHSTGREVLPHCVGEISFKAQTHKAWSDNMCYITSYCFWTFPILCPFAVVLIFWKNLLERRLFYECLMNGIFLTYRNFPFLLSPTFWFILLYGSFSFSCFLFVDRAKALAGRSVKEMLFTMLTYLTPFAQFFTVVFTLWSPNTHIVSLALFFNQDTGKACQLINDSTFIAADDLREVWEDVEEIFEHLRHTEHITFEVDTAELMGMMLHEYKEMERSRPAVYSSFYDKKKFWRRCHCKFWRGYWISRILWFENLKDNLSWQFRFWTRFYVFFMILAGFLFAWAMVSSTQEWIHYQKQLPHDIDIGVDIPGPHEVLSH